jgi:MacB-like periplasmic core domain
VNWIDRFFRKSKLENQLDSELRFHVEQQTAENIGAGMDPDEARRSTLAQFGGLEYIKEETRDARGTQFLESLVQDIRFAVRMVRKSPSFTAVAILTLALGIGATTAIFSIVNSVLLRPLPFKNPSSLVLLHEGFPSLGFSHMGFSPPDLTIFMREQKSFKVIGTFLNERVDISGQGEPDRVTVTRVSASLFPMLAAQPILGRVFTSAEDAPGHQVAILSYQLWRSRYGGASDILRQKIELDRQPYTIIGVMPRNFVFPLAGPAGINSSPAEIWIPMVWTPSDMQNWGGSYFASVLGRLRPGASLEQARAEAESLAPASV